MGHMGRSDRSGMGHHECAWSRLAVEALLPHSKVRVRGWALAPAHRNSTGGRFPGFLGNVWGKLGHPQGGRRGLSRDPQGGRHRVVQGVSQQWGPDQFQVWEKPYQAMHNREGVPAPYTPQQVWGAGLARAGGGDAAHQWKGRTGRANTPSRPPKIEQHLDGVVGVAW